MIFQELAAAPDLTVAENVMLGQWPARRGIVNWRALAPPPADPRRARRRARPRRAGRALRVAERQVIEIARALLGEARCLILDEPTAALSHQEVERLFAFIQRLRERGVAIIYITHRLDEVHRVADRVQSCATAPRCSRASSPTSGATTLVTAMVGKAIGDVERPGAARRASRATRAADASSGARARRRSRTST